MVVENKNRVGLIYETMPSALTTLQIHGDQHNQIMERVKVRTLREEQPLRIV